MTTSSLAVGDELLPLAVPGISRATLALFAGASGDHNPMHIDRDVARSAGLDDVFAHGLLSMAYLGRAVTSWFPEWDLVSFQTRFMAITPVHGTPTCTGTVRSLQRDEAGRELATVELAVHLEDGTFTLRGQAIVRRATDPV